MFGFLADVAKAAVGVVVEAPIALAADVLTLGGAINDRKEPYLASTAKNIMENIENAVKPD